MVQNKFAKRLIDMILAKEKRESLNDLNLTKLARKVEIPPATFHQWLNGVFPKRIEHWIKLKKYFNCDLDYLITGVSIDKKAIAHEGRFIISDNGLDVVEWHYKVKKKLTIKVQ